MKTVTGWDQYFVLYRDAGGDWREKDVKVLLEALKTSLGGTLDPIILAKLTTYGIPLSESLSKKLIHQGSPVSHTKLHYHSQSLESILFRTVCEAVGIEDESEEYLARVDNLIRQAIIQLLDNIENLDKE